MGLSLSLRLKQIGGRRRYTHHGHRFGWVGRTGGKAKAETPPRTNEEWHYMYLNAKQPASAEILNALKEAAIDCQLFRDYNGDPAVRLCYGQTPSDLPAAAVSDTTGLARLPRFDRYCSTLEYLLLQDEDDTNLIEFSLNDINPEGIRLADSFERRCKLASAPIVHLGAVGYRDLLILEALKAPMAVNPAAVFTKYGLKADELLIRDILNFIAKNNTDGVSVDLDLKLWMLVSALSEATQHRPALERLVQHRLNRKSEADLQKFAGTVDQITSWMRLKLELDMAVDALAQFYRQTPSLDSLFPNAFTPPTPTPSAPTLPPEPSAPPLEMPMRAAGASLYRRPWLAPARIFWNSI